MWLDDKRVQIKESSYARYYQVIHGHLTPYFQGQKASQITNETVNKFIKDKLSHGRLDGKGGLSAKSVCDILSILLQIIQYGEKKGAIANFDYDIVRPKSENSELVILSRSEQEKLLQHVKSDLDHKKLGVIIAIYTGIRLGELCALQWSDVDFETGVLYITKTLQRIKNTDITIEQKTKVVITAPKSKKSVREIPLPVSLLCLLKQVQGEQPTTNFILSSKEKHIDTRVYQDNFKQYLKYACVKPVKFHALRHTFATRAIENGFDDKSLSELLGHSSVRFTLERYVHSSIDTKRASMERLAACY